MRMEILTENNTVRYAFFKKKGSSEFTILSRSALSESTKINTLFMETYRRIINCDSTTPWKEVEEHLSRYANCMRISGYSKSQRYHTIKGAVERYRQISREVKEGQRESIYRSGDTIREAKKLKMDWSNTWFLQGDTKDTISCPVTPGGELKRRLTQTVNRDKSTTTKVIEDGGRPISGGLVTKDPMRPLGCIFGDQECIVRKDQNCDGMGVVYRIQCLSCLEIIPEDESERYIGMTRTSVHNRMLAHLTAQRQKKTSSALHRHDVKQHQGIPQKYVTDILASEKKIVKLNCLEAIKIERQPSHLLMNDRNEKGRGGVVRITATRLSS